MGMRLDNIYSSNCSTNIVSGCQPEGKFLPKINDVEKAAYDMCKYNIWKWISAANEQTCVQNIHGTACQSQRHQEICVLLAEGGHFGCNFIGPFEG